MDDWQILTRWIDDNLPYSTLYFFPTLWAVNIQWHERPVRRVDSYAEPKGRWLRDFQSQGACHSSLGPTAMRESFCHGPVKFKVVSPYVLSRFAFIETRDQLI